MDYWKRHLWATSKPGVAETELADGSFSKQYRCHRTVFLNLSDFKIVTEGIPLWMMKCMREHRDVQFALEETK